jgi:hypothetical protein
MDQKEPREETGADFYVLPLVGAAIAGYIIADWISISGILGILIGAFVVDAFRGLRGTHRFVREAEDLVQQLRKRWEKQKGQRIVQEAPPDVKGPSQTSPSEWPDIDESHPSA